jgi:site-specific DNA-methyltransferase (adenine-specific)
MTIRRLYYGDNLDILREQIPDESVDLIYLDPPFNSQASYNVLFKSQKGERSTAQISAFEDTWVWSIQSERYLNDLLKQKGELADLLNLLVRTLGQNSLSAYLVMMAIRLVELHRVLKSTGSFYLHCDPVASHYLKLILDQIFGAIHFKNELIWKRHNARQSTKKYPSVHDVILFYTKSPQFTFNPQKIKGDRQKIPHTLITGEDGKKYQTFELTAPGITKRGESGKAWRGFTPTPMGRHWANRHDVMEKWDREGLIHWPRNGGFPRRRDSNPFVAEERQISINDVWIDIDRINQSANERLGYPTQKPLILLERIIKTSSNPGDIVLDPFCGCGTAVHAAESLDRQWIGIDITHLAISLIEKRLRDAFPDREVQDETGVKLEPGIQFEVEGTPKSLDAARDLFHRDTYQFEWWACSLVNAQPYKDKKKGADSGVDGLIYFRDIDPKSTKKDPTVVRQIVVSVKGGKNVGVSMIRDLRGTMEARKADIGLFVTMTPPTRVMISEAAKAGIYSAGNGQDYARIQILTIEDLLENRVRPEFFDLSRGELTFKKAPRQTRDRSSQLDLKNWQDTLDNS